MCWPMKYWKESEIKLIVQILLKNIKQLYLRSVNSYLNLDVMMLASGDFSHSESEKNSHF